MFSDEPYSLSQGRVNQAENVAQVRFKVHKLQCMKSIALTLGRLYQNECLRFFRRRILTHSH